MSAPVIALREVQANVLLPYTRANCARLTCFRFRKDQLAAARAWMAEVSRLVTYHDAVRDSAGAPIDRHDAGPWWNVGVTFTGMQALGYDPFTLEYMPDAFVEGMRARLGRLGAGPDKDKSPYKGADVHVAVLCYAYDDAVEALARKLGDDAHEWRDLAHADMRALEAAVQRALSDAMAQVPPSSAVEHVAERDHDAYRLSSQHIVGVEYFGFRDGIANPRVEGVPSDDPLAFDTPPGAVLLGYPSPRQSAREPQVPGGETRTELALRQLVNGSFLVVRNLAQDVDGFRKELALKLDRKGGPSAQDLAEHMMGRRRDGTPFAPLQAANVDAFDYDADPHGDRCPFQAHARRVNPRDERARLRRIMRRGMPTSGYLRAREKHGLLFLCYNADLEAQFEFVQHQWINAGAESHGLSVDRDPVAGDTPPSGAEHLGSSFTFTWGKDGKPRTLTGLHSYVEALWGEYFLVPSRSTLAELSRDPRSALAEYRARTANEPDLKVRRDILGRWLDDIAMCRRIFAEVRDVHGGVFRLEREQVVLVASAERVAEVLHDDGARYSVAGQGLAMRQTTGAFYLGMDSHTQEYRQDSAASAVLIPGWQPQSETDAQRELALLEFAAAELCVTFFGLSVTDALARHEDAGKPKRGEIELEKFTAFVVAGMTPKLFGVPQPSAAGAFQMNLAHSGYLFFAFPEETFLEYADRAARGISMYLAQLFVERDRRRRNELFPPDPSRVGSAPAPAAALPQGQVPDERWHGKLDSTLAQLEALFAKQGRTCELDDKVRMLAGIVSGLLITSFKLFVDGVSDYAKTFAPRAALTVDPLRAATVPFATMKQNQRSMPNIIYRRAVRAAQLGTVQVAADDVVLASQGSAMASSGEDWFFGDCTPAPGAQPQSPHFCPGYRVATVLLQTMSKLLFTAVPDLRMEDDSGETFSYDWAALAAFVENARKAAAQAQAGHGV
jgi:Dyp-type peroxidase family